MPAARIIVAFMGMIMLVGCGSTQWVHPRKPKEAFTQDHSDCETTAMASPKVQAASQSGSKFMQEIEIEKCLARKGWLQVEQP